MNGDAPGPGGRRNAVGGALEETLDAARQHRRGVAETGPLLERVLDRLAADEEAVELVAGISAGHDGVLMVTDRRVLFVAPRRSFDLSYEDLDAVAVRGRRFGARLILATRGARTVVSGLGPTRAAEVAAVIEARLGA